RMQRFGGAYIAKHLKRCDLGGGGRVVVPRGALQNEKLLVVSRVIKDEFCIARDRNLRTGPAVRHRAQPVVCFVGLSCDQMLPAWQTHRAQSVTSGLKRYVDRT